MKRHYALISITIFLTLLFNSCKKTEEPCNDASNPNCPNYNPCLGVAEVSAEFKIGQIWSAAVIHSTELYNNAFIEDSIFPLNCSISFRAEEKNAKYTWYLGSEVLTDRRIDRVFSGLPKGKYTVKLIVEKTPNLKCFPLDDGKDTVIKNFYLVDFCELNTMGFYKGVIDDGKDSVFFRLDMCTVKNRAFQDSSSIIDYCGIFNLILSGAINKTIDPFQNNKRLDPVELRYSYIVSNNTVYLGWEKEGGYCVGVGNTIININKDKTCAFKYRTWCEYHTFKGRKL